MGPHRRVSHASHGVSLSSVSSDSEDRSSALIWGFQVYLENCWVRCVLCTEGYRTGHTGARPREAVRGHPPHSPLGIVCLREGHGVPTLTTGDGQRLGLATTISKVSLVLPSPLGRSLPDVVCLLEAGVYTLCPLGQGIS